MEKQKTKTPPTWRNTEILEITIAASCSLLKSAPIGEEVREECAVRNDTKDLMRHTKGDVGITRGKENKITGLKTRH